MNLKNEFLIIKNYIWLRKLQ